MSAQITITGGKIEGRVSFGYLSRQIHPVGKERRSCIAGEAFSYIRNLSC